MSSKPISRDRSGAGGARGLRLVSRFAAYGVAGGLATLTHLAVLAALVEGLAMPGTWASAIGFACAVPVNYVLQHRYVFRAQGNHRTFFLRYIMVTLGTMAVNTGLLFVLYEVFGVFYLLAQIITIGFIVVANFFINMQFTFAARPAEPR